MSEFDSLIDGFDGVARNDSEQSEQGVADTPGAPSSVQGEHRPDVAEVAGSIPAGPTVENPPEVVDTQEEPPFEPDDWPEPEPEIPVFTVTDDLRVLRSDQRPIVGAHYVVFGGKPVPVHRAFSQTEDEFVRSQMDPSDTLKDHDGQRRVRADRTLRQRYRGYVSGEMRSL